MQRPELADAHYDSDKAAVTAGLPDDSSELASFAAWR